MPQTITLGANGPRIPAVGVGTWQWGDTVYWGFGNDFAEKDVWEAFDESVRAGLTFFDTAEVYGSGRSERFLGEFIRKTHTTAVVGTKFMPFPTRLTGGALAKALERSLGRLGLRTVDLYQMHVALPPVAIETWMEAMADVHGAGLVRAVGVSNYSAEQMRRAHEALGRRGIPLASNQVRFSLIDREPFENGLLDVCRELGVTLIAYSPLGKGILSGKYTPENRPGGMRGRRFSRQVFAKIRPLLAILRDIAQSRDKTMAQVAINWCTAKGTLPIPGAKTGAQARENAGALGWSLTENEVQRLDGAVVAL